jgi:hypothetical protein
MNERREPEKITTVGNHSVEWGTTRIPTPIPPWEIDGTPRAKKNVLGVDQCPGKQEVDLCLPRGGIRQKSRAEWKEWSECLGLHILPRVPMGWSSSITGDSTKDALNFP